MKHVIYYRNAKRGLTIVFVSPQRYFLFNMLTIGT